MKRAAVLAAVLWLVGSAAAMGADPPNLPCPPPYPPGPPTLCYVGHFGPSAEPSPSGYVLATGAGASRRPTVTPPPTDTN